MLSSSKTTDLYDRSRQLENCLIDQAQLISEMSASMNRLLSDLARNPGNNVSSDNIDYASLILERARKVSPLENLVDAH